MYSSNLSKGNNSLSECDELDLVERIRKGNQEAFRSLVLYYEPRLLAHLLPMLGNIENARDILQETFLVVFQELPTWKRGLTGTSGHPLAPWIYRIATNKALSLLRKQSVRAKYGHEQASAGGRCNARNEMPFPLQEHMSIEELVPLFLYSLTVANRERNVQPESEISQPCWDHKDKYEACYSQRPMSGPKAGKRDGGSWAGSIAVRSPHIPWEHRYLPNPSSTNTPYVHLSI